jgi:DNA-binding transcriptional LysR family regulator
VRELTSVPFDLVGPASHPLARLSAVHIGQLTDEPFLDFPRGYGNRAVVDQAFAAANIRHSVGLEVTDVASAADFVRHGLGLLPRFVIPEDPVGLDYSISPRRPARLEIIAG